MYNLEIVNLCSKIRMKSRTVCVTIVRSTRRPISIVMRLTYFLSSLLFCLRLSSFSFLFLGFISLWFHSLASLPFPSLSEGCQDT